MNRLECNLIVKSCPTHENQSYQNCYMCEHLIVKDDILLSAETVIEDLLELNEKKSKDISNKALRFNEGKSKWSYVHYKSLEPMIRVLKFGALKYAPFN